MDPTRKRKGGDLTLDIFADLDEGDVPRFLDVEMERKRGREDMEDVASDLEAELEGEKIEDEELLVAKRKSQSQNFIKQFGEKGNDSSDKPQLVNIYQMDIDVNQPLIVAYESDMLYSKAYDQVCNIMKCASGCIFKQGTKISMEGRDILPKGNYDFMVFPRRGGGFARDYSGVFEHKDGVSKFLSCQAWLVNERVHPPTRLLADIVLDSAFHLDLILPKRKALQLELKKVEETTVRGFGGFTTNMIIYKCVEVCLLAEDGNTVFKRADLHPASIAEEVANVDEVEQHLESLDGFAGLRGGGGIIQTSGGITLTVDADFMDVTPVRVANVPTLKMVVKQFIPLHRNSGVPNAILGVSGLSKLGLTVDFKERVLMLTTPVSHFSAGVVSIDS